MSGAYASIIRLLLLCLLPCFASADVRDDLKRADGYFQEAFTKEGQAQEDLYLKERALLLELKKQKPKDPRIYAKLAQVTGRLALFRGNKEKIKLGKEVKDYADQALALDPENATANAVLGVWHYELAKLSAFERLFAKLLFGSVPEGDFSKSKEYLLVALEQNPTDVFFHVALAKTLIELDEKKSAKRHVEVALALPERFASDRLQKKEAADLLERLKD